MEQLSDCPNSEVEQWLKNNRHSLGLHKIEGFLGDQKKPVLHRCRSNCDPELWRISQCAVVPALRPQLFQFKLFPTLCGGLTLLYRSIIGCTKKNQTRHQGSCLVEVSGGSFALVVRF